MKRAPVFISLPLIIAFIAAQAVFVAAYVEHEHTIYFWDHAMYFGMARSLFETCGRSLAGGWAVFKNALANNYNLIFALPSLVGFKLFGPSRLVFILVNFFIFFLFFEAAAAFLLRRALGMKWTTAFVISLGACMLIPPLWLPLFEGYPDIGAAGCIAFAAGLCLAGLKKPRILLRGLETGLVLGFAVLLRRHFVYPALALLAAAGCLALQEIGRAARQRRRYLGRASLYFIGCGAGFAGLLALVAPEFLQTALTTDFNALYFSYRRPPLIFLRFMLGGFGIGLLLVAVSGLALLAWHDRAGRRFALFVTLFTFLCLAIWCAGPDQMGHHYMLHALPLFIIAGLAGWVVFFARQKNSKKYLLAGTLALGLSANSAWALWFSPTGVWPNDNGTPGLLSAARPPVIRPDYDEWLRLAAYLRDTTKPDDRIMMVGSSFVFNLDLIHSIYMDILHAPGMVLRFPKPPEIDHEEPAPFDVFAASDVYVVPDPPQYHLDPAGQRVVTAAANRFPPPPPRAGLFHADAAVFHLADGVAVRIWRRDAWTPGILHDALDEIGRDGPADANFAQGWATTVLPLRAHINTDAQNLTSALGLMDAAHRKMDLFFMQPLAAGNYRLGLAAAATCPALRFHLDVFAQDGQKVAGGDFAPAVMPGNVFQSFSVPEKTDRSYFLQLDLAAAPAALCLVRLQDLRIETQP